MPLNIYRCIERARLYDSIIDHIIEIHEYPDDVVKKFNEWLRLSLRSQWELLISIGRGSENISISPDSFFPSTFIRDFFDDPGLEQKIIDMCREGKEIIDRDIYYHEIVERPVPIIPISIRRSLIDVIYPEERDYLKYVLDGRFHRMFEQTLHRYVEEVNGIQRWESLGSSGTYLIIPPSSMNQKIHSDICDIPSSCNIITYAIPTLHESYIDALNSSDRYDREVYVREMRVDDLHIPYVVYVMNQPYKCPESSARRR